MKLNNQYREVRGARNSLTSKRKSDQEAWKAELKVKVDLFGKLRWITLGKADTANKVKAQMMGWKKYLQLNHRKGQTSLVYIYNFYPLLRKRMLLNYIIAGEYEDFMEKRNINVSSAYKKDI